MCTACVLIELPRGADHEQLLQGLFASVHLSVLLKLEMVTDAHCEACLKRVDLQNLYNTQVYMVNAKVTKVHKNM